MNRYDVIIIGSGLGGLECAAILSKEGMSVCVLEKNGAVGGCLQSFSRFGHLLDTGIHYIGSMDKGQILNQYFNYFGVLNRVKFKRLDSVGFDVVSLRGKEYNYASGFANFEHTLSEYFPQQRRQIGLYTERIKNICDLISVENLSQGVINRRGFEQFGISAAQTIAECVDDPTLRNVLAGTVTLYGGEPDLSSIYCHAMICGSNIEGAYRLVDGSQSLADAFVATIRENGGVVLTNCAVNRIVVEETKVVGVEVEGGERFEAKNFISNVHPSITLDLLDKTPAIKKAFVTRVRSLKNTYGLFSVYLILKPNSFRYINRNYYLYDTDDAWCDFSQPGAPRFALLSAQATSANPEFADVVTLLAPMYFHEVAKWGDTRPDRRGADYEAFKNARAQRLIDFVCERFPTLRPAIDRVVTTTPLSYRDYTATPEGSAYGIVKDFHNPLAGLLSARTKIPNLYLTGQNLNVHGALGVTLTAALTCAELVGSPYLAKKIGSV